MTDKQIMIDGVNVAGCVRLQDDEISCDLGGECKGWENCYFKQLARKTQECEQIKEKYEALKLENQEGYEIVAELKHECEELKKANQHIDTNRQCKGSKLKRIEELISDCETGYTDEFIQKIYGIIQEPEPTVNDYSITDRYRKALEEIEGIAKNFGSYAAWQEQRINKILDIINKAKDGN